MAYIGEEITLFPVGGFGSFLGRLQLQFNELPFGKRIGRYGMQSMRVALPERLDLALLLLWVVAVVLGPGAIQHSEWRKMVAVRIASEYECKKLGTSVMVIQEFNLLKEWIIIRLSRIKETLFLPRGTIRKSRHPGQ